MHIGCDVSKEVLDDLQKIMTIPTYVDQTLPKDKSRANQENIQKETNTAQQQIKSVLDEVNKIEQRAGSQIHEIRAGDLQISRNELQLKRDYSKSSPIKSKYY